MNVIIEAELLRRLKIVEEEHATRLDQMVRAQRELSKIEKEQEIVEAVTIERQVRMEIIGR